MRADLVRDVRRPLLTLLAAVGSLLLIGCASLANLLIARAVARSGELVLRSALGASRGRRVRQSLTELLPLLIAGGAVGLVLANGIIGAVLPWLPQTLPRLEAVTIGAPVICFAALLLVFTAVATGIWPALQVARWDVASALRQSLRGASTTLHGARRRDALVIVQISVAVLLTISAALLTRSFINIRRIDPGFRPASVLTMQLAIPRAKYPADRQVSELCRAILDHVRRLPGVRAAGMVNRLPLGGVAQINRIQLDRSALPDNVTVDSRSVSADYFSALGIPLKSGRIFTDADIADAPPVGLVDDQLARMAWPDRSAIGQRFRFPGTNFPWITIVGIVGHVRHDALTTDARPQVYWHYLQRAQDRMALVVRADGDAAGFVRQVMAEIRATDPEQPVYEVRTMEAVVDRATGQQWLTAAVLTTFAALALLMAGIGVYGVISYGVRLRAREFGIRIALGALRQDVMMMVVRRGATLAGWGLMIGVGAALVVTRGLASLLQDVSTTDVVSFAVATCALGVAALIATILPARRAVETEPIRVLRGE
jgi:putative ABC transport system permease protein